MDNIFDAPFCPSLDEVTEAECPVKMHSDRDNDWGPTQYNRNHHPLHIMVRIVYLYVANCCNC